jgi:competence protein ComEC
MVIKRGPIEQPLAWAGIGVWMGAWSWPWLEPGGTESALVACLLAVFGVLSRKSRLGTLAAFLATVSLGWMSPSIVESWEPPPGQSHDRLRVIDEVGPYRLVEGQKGRLLLRFSGEAPRVGAEVLCWWETESLRRGLPGAWNLDGIRVRAKAQSGRVRDWARLGGPQPEEVQLPRGRHRALLRALLLGDTQEVDPEQEALFTRTGTRHLMAVSGLHLGLVAGLVGLLVGGCIRLFSWLGRGGCWRLPRLLGSMASVWTAVHYASIVGWPVSARRSLIMVAVGALAVCIGRRPRAWSLLGLAAGCIILLMPWQATRPGFLLSFGAVAGILHIGPLLTRWVSPELHPLIRWTLKSLSVSLAASLGTLPVSAWVFQEWAPVSPLANLLVGPVVAFGVVPLGLGAWVLDGAAGQICWEVTHLAIDVLLWTLQMLDMPVWHPAVGPVGALGLTLALCVARRPLWSVMMIWLILRPVTELEASRDWTLTFLDVGQGDATLVEWPDGRRWLVDGGPPSRGVLYWLRRQQRTRLDVVVLTHPDQDHLGGLLPVIESLDVGELWLSRRPRRNEDSFRELWRLANFRGIRIRLRPEIQDRSLLPAPTGCQNDNECGLVLHLELDETRVLLTGDIGFPTENVLIGMLDRIDVLKIGHHGSSGSTSREFLDQTRPILSIISVGSRNMYGHPSMGALSRLRGLKVLRTDRDGTVEVRCDEDGVIEHQSL